MKRSITAFCLLLALLPASSTVRACWLCPSENGPSYAVLKTEVRRLNWETMPYAHLLDRLIERAGYDRPVPMALAARLVSLDEQVQHVNAAVLRKEEAPGKVQRQIERIRVELCELHADWEALTATWSPSGH